jgi:hypothetical protein
VFVCTAASAKIPKTFFDGLTDLTVAAGEREKINSFHVSDSSIIFTMEHHQIESIPFSNEKNDSKLSAYIVRCIVYHQQSKALCSRAC